MTSNDTDEYGYTTRGVSCKELYDRVLTHIRKYPNATVDEMMHSLLLPKFAIIRALTHLARKGIIQHTDE